MKRPDYLAFGVAGYLAALLSMVYLAGFLANLYVPKGVDSAPTGPTGRAVAIDLGLLAAFGLAHSLLARKPVQRRLALIFPPALERSLYCLIAGVQIGLLCWGWQALPAPFWDVPAGWTALRTGLWGLQAAGWGVVIVALATLGSTHLFGLQQAASAARGVPYVAPPFEVRGLYRFVRHPVYTGSLIAFWSSTTMSHGRLLLVAGLTTYLVIGLAFEERDLEREHGETYLAYKRMVPALFPRPLK